MSGSCTGIRTLLRCYLVSTSVGPKIFLKLVLENRVIWGLKFCCLIIYGNEFALLRDGEETCAPCHHPTAQPRPSPG